jgi:methyl-accepting chemotaxis protein
MLTLGIRARLYAVALGATIGLGALGGLAIYAARHGTAALDHVYQESMVPLALLQSIDGDLKDVRFRMAGVLLDLFPFVGSSNHAKEVRQKIPNTWAEFQAQPQPADLSGDAAEAIGTLGQGMKAVEPLFDKLIKAYASDDKKEVGRMLEEEWPVLHAKVLKPIDKLMPAYKQAVLGSYEASQAATRQLLTTVIGVLLATGGGFLLVTIGVVRQIGRKIAAANAAVEAIAGLDLRREVPSQGRDEIGQLLGRLAGMRDRLVGIVTEIREGAEQMDRASGRLASSSDETAGTVASQSDAASNIAAAVEELSTSIDQVGAHAQEANALTQGTGEASRRGTQVIGSTTREMQSISDAVSASARIVAELESQSGEISGIVDVIKGIADQTNLLALNAAIEAARAGDSGRGFAVVASEVRNLAERTSQSTLQIADLIGRIQANTQRVVQTMHQNIERVEGGVRLVAQAGESMSEIEGGAARVMDSVGAINRALSEQGGAAREIAERVERIASLTDIGSSAAQRTASTAQEVAKLATGLRRVADRFVLT